MIGRWRKPDDLTALADATRELPRRIRWVTDYRCGCRWTTHHRPVLYRPCPRHALQAGTIRDLLTWEQDLPMAVQVLADILGRPR